MITDADNVYEILQNEIAAELMTKALFQGIDMPDGSAWRVLTEDEGDVEFMFEKMISDCGLSVIVQSPTSEVNAGSAAIPTPQLTLSVAISISEAIEFNRQGGTGVRCMRAVTAVETLHDFKPPSINKPLRYKQLLKDRDTHPETGQLVASRICLFEISPYFLITK